MKPAGIARSPARRAGAVIAALLLPHGVSHAQAAPVAPRADTATVILLGTGMPYPDPSAQGPATAVTVGDRLFLFDAGAGVVRQMNAAKLPVRGGPVTAVFLTHLHSDHTLGLADVAALTRVVESREPWRPLSDEKLLRRYVRARALPTWAMGRVTDGLLQLFSHEAPAARELRNRGLGLVNRLTPIKRWLTARALDS